MLQNSKKIQRQGESQELKGLLTKITKWKQIPWKRDTLYRVPVQIYNYDSINKDYILQIQQSIQFSSKIRKKENFPFIQRGMPSDKHIIDKMKYTSNTCTSVPRDARIEIWVV
jgi:hypothetical protein